jgi:hypothetical protein
MAHIDLPVRRLPANLTAILVEPQATDLAICHDYRDRRSPALHGLSEPWAKPNDYCPHTEGLKMDERTIADISGKTIDIECRVCSKYAKLEKKKLVKRFGADARVEELRRPLAMGCEKMMGPGGENRCSVRFPCLLSAAIAACSVEE